MDKDRIFVIPLNMENRDPKDIARDAANKIGLLMDQLMKQMNEKSKNQQKHEE